SHPAGDLPDLVLGELRFETLDVTNEFRKGDLPLIPPALDMDHRHVGNHTIHLARFGVEQPLDPTCGALGDEDHAGPADDPEHHVPRARIHTYRFAFDRPAAADGSQRCRHRSGLPLDPGVGEAFGAPPEEPRGDREGEHQPGDPAEDRMAGPKTDTDTEADGAHDDRKNDPNRARFLPLDIDEDVPHLVIPPALLDFRGLLFSRFLSSHDVPILPGISSPTGTA